MCVYVCVCVRKYLKKTTKMGVAWEVTFFRLQFSGHDLRTLVGETTGNAKRDLAKSCGNMNPEVMI